MFYVGRDLWVLEDAPSIDCRKKPHHIYFTCPFSLSIWMHFLGVICNSSWQPSNCIQSITSWDGVAYPLNTTPFYVIWEIWNARNRCIFEDSPPHSALIIKDISTWTNINSCIVSDIKDLSGRIRPHQIILPALFLDVGLRFIFTTTTTIKSILWWSLFNIYTVFSLILIYYFLFRVLSVTIPMFL